MHDGRLEFFQIFLKGKLRIQNLVSAYLEAL